MNRFLAKKANILANEVIIDELKDIHHITRVLRLGNGDAIGVFDSEGWEYHVEISAVSQKEIRGRIIDKSRNAREPEIKVTLFQGIPKHGKMESIIQKSVELGVNGIVPVFMARTERKAANNMTRWRKISEEAVKQCRRAVVPEISEEASYEDMIRALKSMQFDAAIFAYENEECHTIKEALKGIENKPRSIAVVIGPEGGFSDEEAAALKEAGGKPVSLGKTILRTETAGPAAIAMIMYELEM